EGGSYLGRRPTSIWSRLPADRLRPWIDEKFSVNDVQTVEASLELEGFRKIMRGPGSVGRDGAAVLRAYIWQVLGNRREAWYATAMIGCWTLLRIAGSWTRKWAWMARRRGRLQQLAEGLLFPRGR
ncbi:MAG TPA: hypothetical protein VLA89_04405, partial [Gemmatimonadales bacterium]|nr:hypothetical protein [Gemmatimonadales bacterium]